MTTTIVLLYLAMAIPASAAVSAQAPCERVRWESPFENDSTFGAAVALRGGRLAIGAPTVSPFQPGRVLVYERTPSGWSLAGDLAAADGEGGDLFGYAVAIEGDTLLVGRRDDGALHSKGSAYVFTRTAGGAWEQTQKIVDPAFEAWAFGWSIALDGDRAAIAAKGAGSVGPKGRVFIYEREGSTWVQRAKVKPSLDDLEDWFGAAVALEGERLVIGAPKTGSGRAYVFDRQPSGEWVEQALLLPEDLAPFDEYGQAVALDGDRIAIGAFAHDLPIHNGGAVYLFDRTPEGWQQSAKLTTPPIKPLPRYGHSVALRGDELLVGAPTEGSLFPSAGAVYLYRLVEGAWTEVAKFAGSEPFQSRWFGDCLARDGEEFVVGAHAQSSTLPGRAYLFSMSGGAHLDGASPAVGLASGGAQPMQIAACAEHAGDVYALLGSATGTGGGIPLGEAALPLVVDAYFAFTMTQPNNALLPASVGVLDAWGRADAAFVLPPAVDPALAGVMLHHAYVVLDWPTLEVELASNAIPVTLVP